MKNTIIIVIALLLVVAGCTITGNVTKETIRMGVIAPLTGDAAAYGQSEKNAVELAVEEINSNGGIDGKLLEVIFEDGKCNGMDAVTAAQKLINVDRVKIILGGACSGETLAIAPLAEQNEVLVFSSFSSSPDLTDAGDFIFRNAPSDEIGGRDAVRMIYDDGHKRVAILSENTDYAQGVRRVAKEAFEEKGVEIVADELVEMESKDFRTQLVKIKASNPDAVFFNPQTGISGGLAVKQAKELEVNVPYYGTFVYSSGDALTNGGKALDGIKFTDAPGLSEKNEKAVLFLEEYLARYPKPASDYEAGARYDSVWIMEEAIGFCGINTGCLRDYLYNLERHEGTIGVYSFDSNGDVEGINYAIKKIVNGEVVELE